MVTLWRVTYVYWWRKWVDFLRGSACAVITQNSECSADFGEARGTTAAFHMMASWWQFSVSRYMYRSFLVRARSIVSRNTCLLYRYEENVKVSLFFSESSLICQLNHMFIIQIWGKSFGCVRDATCPHTATFCDINKTMETSETLLFMSYWAKPIRSWRFRIHYQLFIHG
jgi:hypothetical protein